MNLGFVKRMHEVGNEDHILKDYEDLPHGLGYMPGEHHVTPVVHTPRMIPVVIRDKAVEELHRMEKMGVITRQREPTERVDTMVAEVTPRMKQLSENIVHY